MRWSRLRLRVRTTDEQSRSTLLSDSLTAGGGVSGWRPPSARYRRAADRRMAVVSALASSFVDGPWAVHWMTLRAAYDLEIAADEWLFAIARRVIERFPERPVASAAGPPLSAHHVCVEFIAAMLDEAMARRQAAEIEAWIFEIERSFGPPSTYTPWNGPPSSEPERSQTSNRWGLPEIVHAGALGERLNLDPGSLRWFADTGSFERTAGDENLRHYDYHWIPKRSGGARLLEAPKQNLKHIQRELLRDIVSKIPAHDAAHGFVVDRSIQTFAAPHTGRDWVLRIDLADFFSSVSADRVFGIFHSAGYRREVARLLSGLVTNATPRMVLASREHDRSVARDARLRAPHLPQGAPTSPALANLAAFGLDVRLTALAERFDARYTRYADDLAFSGNGAGRSEVDRLIDIVRTIITEEGFAVNPTKTSVRRSHQRQVLTGLVINEHLNVHRRDIDRLRAELHEAVTKGPAHANRNGHRQYRSHLQGRLGFVQATNPAKARKLWSLFDAIDWT